MKALTTAILFSALIPAASFATISDRPSTIICKLVETHDVLPKEIIMTKLNTSSPENDIADASLIDELDEKEVKASGIVALFYSNECDNGYTLTFLNANLVDLKFKKVKSITASIRGGNSDAEEEATSSMICTLK
jgi:hypothetical protein